MKYVVLTGIVIFFLIPVAFSQNKYVCFQSDSIKTLKMAVLFDKNRKAKFVKYAGQKDSIPLYYHSIYKNKNPGGIPAVYWAATYLEKVNGKITGEYTFTNAGTFDLDVTYLRKRDNREFYFEVIDDQNKEEGFPYRAAPCF